jgi:hypothetical protein
MWLKPKTKTKSPPAALEGTEGTEENQRAVLSECWKRIPLKGVEKINNKTLHRGWKPLPRLFTLCAMRFALCPDPVPHAQYSMPHAFCDGHCLSHLSRKKEPQKT